MDFDAYKETMDSAMAGAKLKPKETESSSPFSPTGAPTSAPVPNMEETEAVAVAEEEVPWDEEPLTPQEAEAILESETEMPLPDPEGPQALVTIEQISREIGLEPAFAKRILKENGFAHRTWQWAAGLEADKVDLFLRENVEARKRGTANSPYQAIEGSAADLPGNVAMPAAIPTAPSEGATGLGGRVVLYLSDTDLAAVQQAVAENREISLGEPSQRRAVCIISDIQTAEWRSL